MPMPEETSKRLPNVEGELDDNEKHDGDITTTLVPKPWSIRDGKYNFDLDGWMRKYVRWTDDKPLYSRCVVSATTAFLGVLLARATATGGNKREYVRSQNRHGRKPHGGIDVLEAISFAVHGGLVAGPLSYYLEEYLKRKNKKREEPLLDSRILSSTYDFLIMQVAMAPPKLYLTFLTVDITKNLLARTLPNASQKSIALLASAVSDSLRFWPLSIYVLLKLLKKRRHYAAAINLCSIAFSMHLAKKRNAMEN